MSNKLQLRGLNVRFALSFILLLGDECVNSCVNQEIRDFYPFVLSALPSPLFELIKRALVNAKYISRDKIFLVLTRMYFSVN